MEDKVSMLAKLPVSPMTSDMAITALCKQRGVDNIALFSIEMVEMAVNDWRST